MQLGAERVRTAWPYGYEYRITDLKIQWTQLFTVVKVWQHAHERVFLQSNQSKTFYVSRKTNHWIGCLWIPAFLTHSSKKMVWRGLCCRGMLARLCYVNYSKHLKILEVLKTCKASFLYWVLGCQDFLVKQE